MTGRNGSQEAGPDYDVVVVGAGFAGLYLLRRLREQGFSTRVLESADDVGGTWYWNRYPGARCDIPTTDYTYSFDPELERDWTWSEKYATQPEILRYLQLVADSYDLRRDIDFSTRVAAAAWDDAASLWRIAHRRAATSFRAGFYVMATGCLSMPKEVDIEGAERFAGRRVLHQPLAARGRGLHRQAGRRHRHRLVGRSSPSRSSPRRPPQLTVFQRTPNFSVPAHNGPAPAGSPRGNRRPTARPTAMRRSGRAGGVPCGAARASPRRRAPRRSAALASRRHGEAGELFAILGIFADQVVNPEANEIVAEMIREKIRSIVNDPETAESLCPKDHSFGTKRPCLDTGYFETFNLPHVRLVDLRKDPIKTITETGIDTVGESFEFDAIVYATGFDAMTGALVVGRHHRP